MKKLILSAATCILISLCRDARAQLNISGNVQSPVTRNSYTNDLTTIGNVDWWCFNSGNADITQTHEEKSGGTAFNTIVSTGVQYTANNVFTTVEWSDGTTLAAFGPAQEGVRGTPVEDKDFYLTFNLSLDAATDHYEMQFVGTDKRTRTWLSYSLNGGSSWTPIANEVINNAKTDWIYTVDIANVLAPTNILFQLKIHRWGGGFQSLGSLTLHGFSSGQPQMSVLGTNGVAISNGDMSPGLADTTDFGAWPVGYTVTNTYAVTNSGTGDLTLIGTPRVVVSGDGDFTFVDVSTNIIAAGSNAQFRIRFAPAASGTRTGLVSIANDDPDDDPFVFAINGGLHAGGTLYWDGLNSGGSNGVSEIWSATASNWNPVVDYTGAPFAWNDGARGDFRGGGGTVALATSVAAEGAYIRTAGYTIAPTVGEVLTLGSQGLTLNNGINQSPGVSATVSAGMALSADCTITCGRREMLTVSGDLDVGAATLLVTSDKTGAWQKYSGDISGSGAIRANNNQAILSGDNSGFTGTWEVLNGWYARLIVQHANALGNASALTLNGRAGTSLFVEESATFSGTVTNAQGGADAPKVDVSAGKAFTLAGKVTGDSMTLLGDGTVLLTHAANDFSGPLAVNAGTLGGTHGSTGGAAITVQNAALAPGLSIDTFTHTGDVTFDANGTFAIELDASSSDLLAITGDLAISNTTTTLDITELAAPVGAVYTIITYTGTRTGEFAVLNGMPAGYGIEYDDANKRVILKGSPDLVMVGTNGNTIASGDTSPDADDGTDFGLVLVGASEMRTFTITNTGLATLEIADVSAFAITGDSDDFSVTSLSDTSIAPAGAATVDIAFAPTVYGTRTGLVSITSNDPVDMPYRFGIGGGLALPVTLYWDGQATGASNGVSEAWDETAANWNTVSDYSGAPYGWIDGANALFGGQGGTVAQNADAVAGALTFRTGGYTIAPAADETLTLSAITVDNLIQNNNGITATIGSDIVLSANTSIHNNRGEKLILSGDIDCGAHNLTIDSHFNGTYHVFDGDVSGSGTVKLVASELRLSGDNSGFTGTWHVDNARDEDFLVQSANALGNASRLIVEGLSGATAFIKVSAAFAGILDSRATSGYGGYTGAPRLNVADGVTFTAGGPLTGAGLRKGGTGTLLLTSAANDFTGPLTVLVGTLGGTRGSTSNALLTVASSATLAPGVGLGTFGHTGTNVFEDGSTLLIEVGGASSDLLRIEGDLSISNLSTILSFSEVAPLTLPSYTFITNTGTRVGEFVTVNNLPAGYEVVYEANRVLLDATGNDLQLSTPTVANLTTDSSTGRVYLSSPSGNASDAMVTLYWVAGGDPGATFTGWDDTNILATAQSVDAFVEAAMTNLLSDTAYSYRFYATNAIVGTSVWSVAGAFTSLVSDIGILGAGGTAIANGDSTPRAADGTDFQSVRFDRDSDTHTFTITNSGNGILELTGAPAIEVAGAGFTALSPSSTSVAPGGTATFDVKFEPLAEMLYTGLVSIAANDPDENPYTFALQGRGDPEADDFEYRMQIVFGGYDKGETLTNFPALVHLDAANIPEFGYWQFWSATGGDLRFSDESGSQWLNYEIDDWDTGGESLVWVQVPAFTNNAAIWAYWRTSIGATNSPAYATNGATWSEGFDAVWHMNEAAAQDSTAHARDATAEGNGVSTAGGRIGSGVSLAGSDDYLRVYGYKGVTGATARTMSAWMNSSASANDCIMSWGDNSSAGKKWTYLVENTGGPKVEVASGWKASDGDFTDGNWHLVTFSLRGNAPNIADGIHYGDGVRRGTTVNGQAVNTSNANDVRLGLEGHTGDHDYTGLLDEVRISSVARSSNWVWACYMNVASHETFATYRVYAPPPTLFIVK